MADEGFKRKLAAILSADVEGYSRLMDDDEEETVRTLTAYRTAINDLVQQYRGRVVDTPGDNILAEFTSVVDAINCAVKIQRELAERNAELPYNRKMEFRIGVNIGDVIEEEGRIYGDGVNIAARLESMAEAGGICISGRAYDQVANKLGLEYENLGEHQVKNITTPIRVFRVLSFPGAAAHRVVQAKKAVGKKWRNLAVAAGSVALIVAVAVGVWQFYTYRPKVEPASVEKMAYPLPDKPSIAVLPFENMSGDPSQDYFSDGLTDQIISTLSKFRSLFVISRTSTFTYKGKPVKVQKVAEDLGVKYVLEGSVQRTADRIRITAQLIDATTGHHIWSARYDREPKDIFAIQDDITLEITKALRVKFTVGEQARLWAKSSTTNLTAWKKYVQAADYVFRFSKGDNAIARRLLEEAIVLDPMYADAYVGLSTTHFFDARFGWVKSRAESVKMALKYAQKALELNDTLDSAYTMIGGVYFLQGQYENAIAEGERAIALNPNGALSYQALAGWVGCSGRWDESVELAKKSIRLQPFPPASYYHWLGRAYFMTEQYDEAIATLNKALHVNPNYLPAHAFLAACYSSSNRQAEAESAAKEVLRINPNFTLESYAKTLPYKNKADVERYVAALRKAGLPEHPPLSLPDKPSIAVLPFDNLSKDPEQEYFVDGMTDDLITDLSKISGLFIIARNSTFQYKGKAVDVKKVSRELSIRYVLEGSVRKAGDKVRINAQLIDATTGGHLWAERYDGQMEDIFSLQDKITQKIVTALAVKLTPGEKENIASKGTANIEAYDAFLKGWEHCLRLTPEDFAKAVAYLEKAIELDPNYGRAYAAMALIYWTAGLNYEKWEPTLGVTMEECYLSAPKYLAKAMDNPTSLAHQMGADMMLYKRLHGKATFEAERAIELDPNDARAQFMMGKVLIFDGRPEKGAEFIKKAMRLDPLYPAEPLCYLGLAHFCMGQLEEAVSLIERGLKHNPELVLFNMPLAAAFAHQGLSKKAQQAVATWRQGFHLLNLSSVMFYYPFKDLKFIEQLVEGLIRAGWWGDTSEYYKISEENRLAGEQIKSLVFGRKMAGFEGVIERAKDGTAYCRQCFKSIESFSSMSLTFRDTGKSWVEDDMLCDQWQTRLQGQKICSPVFRNPEGKPEKFDEYFSIPGLGEFFGIIPWSPVD